MTGSNSALIVIPIVALISLAVLLTMVFYADYQQQRVPAICPPTPGGTAVSPTLGPLDEDELKKALATLRAETADADTKSRAIADRAMQFLVVAVAIAGIMVAGWLVVVQIRLQLIQLDKQLVPGTDLALTRAGLWGLSLAAGSAVLSGVFAAAAWRRGYNGGNWTNGAADLPDRVVQQLEIINQTTEDTQAADRDLRLATWIFSLGFSIALLAALAAGLI